MNRINRYITDNYIRKIKASKKTSKDAKEMTDIDYERISEIILMKYSNLISWSLILILVENIAYECIKLFRDVKKKEATYEKDL